MKIIYAFFFLLIFSPGLTYCQSILTDTIFTEEAVITGTKTAVSRNNVPLTLSVITQKEIEESSESSLLPVLGEQVPGVFITERGITGFGVAAGSAGSITIRGIGGNPNTGTLVLLNGNPQFQGLMGHPLPDAYVASDVARVEIIRGPASTLYGSNAMGGVINIITKEQRQEGFKANARTMYGSYTTQKYMANAGYKNSGFSSFISFNHDNTEGHRDSSGFKINNGYIKLGFDIHPALNINADFSIANFTATDPGPENSFAGYSIDITRGMGSLALDNQFSKTNGSFRFFYNYGEHNITDGFHSTDDNFGVVLYQSFNLFNGNIITLGADYKKYGGLAENVKAMNGRGILLGDKHITETAGYGYFQQTFFNTLILNAGLRLDNNSIYGSEIVPSAGAAYHITNSTTIKASVAKGFRSPTIRELYLFPPANANLEPERMINYEIGVIQELLANRLNIDLTVYKLKGDNLIKTIVVSGIPRNMNTGSFSNTGFEFAGAYYPLESLSFRLNYSYISMDEKIIATPEQQLFLSGTYTWNKLSFNLSVQQINNLYTRVTPAEEKENYTLLNTKISYMINRYLDIFIKAENLTDEKYYINYGYPMPGIITFGGVNLHF